jgi:hypothetical protein
MVVVSIDAQQGNRKIISEGGLHDVEQVDIYQELVVGFRECKDEGGVLTQRMTAAQLWLLAVLALELVANAVQQLDIALIRVLLQARQESIGHGTRSLVGNRSIGPVVKN